MCVGDSAQEKGWGVSIETVVRQMKIALAGLARPQVEQVIIAYEPVWAIGDGGTPATADEAQTIHRALRQALADTYGPDTAENVTLLYGGSVNPHNSSALIQCPDIDGLFIGRSAWDAEGFCRLAHNAATWRER